MTIVLQVPEFPHFSAHAYFIDSLKDVLTSNIMGKEKKKVGESFHNATLNKKLESHA